MGGGGKQHLETAKTLLMVSVIFTVDFPDNVTLLMA